MSGKVFGLILGTMGLLSVSSWAPGNVASSGQASPSSLGKVAYVKEGDIWVKDLPDGAPRRLTTDGKNSRPRWSPSGEWLAFRKGRDREVPVWVMRADGSGGHALSHSPWISACVWSPKTDRLAYIIGEWQGNLRAVNADGTEPATLDSRLVTGNIAWSPEGDWLAYQTQEYTPEGFEKGGVWKVRANGSRSVLLPAPMPKGGTPGFPILAGWVGPYVLYWQAEETGISIMADGAPLYALSADGGKPRLLSGKEMEGMLLYQDFLDNSPDGKFLTLSEGGFRETWTNKKIVVVELATSRRTVLTRDKKVALSPAWSPDRQRLAYVSGPDMGQAKVDDERKVRAAMNKRRIWIMDRDGSNKRQLTTDDKYRDERPQWSVAGRHILFARISNIEGGEDIPARGSLWLMSVEGGPPAKLAELPLPPQGIDFPLYGFYGHTDWGKFFDWWKGGAR